MRLAALVLLAALLPAQSKKLSASTNNKRHKNATRSPNVATHRHHKGSGGAHKLLSSPQQVCTAADIGLGPGMLSTAKDAPSVGSSLTISGCTQLDLSLSPIGAEGALALAQALGKSSATREQLTHVNLTWSSIGSGSTQLLKALGSAKSLLSLDLSGNWLGDESAAPISRMVRKATELQVLRLRWNGFTEAGAKYIAQALGMSDQLIELDLGGNWIGTAGADHISRRLPRHPVLQRLRLDHNGIEAVALRAIAQAIAGNVSAIQSLDVGGNEIDDSGVSELARLLPETRLTKVSLRLNERVTDAGAAMLAAAIGSSAQITHLDLGGTRIGNAGAARSRGPSVPAQRLPSCYWTTTRPSAASEEPTRGSTRPCIAAYGRRSPRAGSHRCHRRRRRRPANRGS